MEKFDPVDIEFLINSPEVKADSKKVKDELRGIGTAADEATAKVGGKGGSGGIAPPLDQAGDAAERAGRKAAKARPQWNGLGNSINQLTREIPAFTYSAQTGFLALSNNIPILADEIGRLKAQNDALVASGKKGIPVWKQVLKGLLSWQTALSLGVAILTIYGGKIVEYISQLFKSKEAVDAHKKSVEALNKAYESTDYQNLIKDIIELKSQINLAKKGLIDKKDALDKYNTVLGDAYKKTDDLNEAERILVEKAPALIESMLYKSAATMAAADAAKELAENQKKLFELDEEKKPLTEDVESGKEAKEAANSRSGFVSPNYQSQRITEIDKEIKELEDKETEIQEKTTKIVDQLNQKAAEIAKGAGLDIFGDDDPEPTTEKVLNQRKKLLEKIADLDREFAQKRLDEDKAELDALREKFDKVRALIEDFNKDPKNKANKIDVTGLGVIQENAEADLIYRQDSRKLVEELSKQKKLYEEIEQYKADFGIAKTKERYSEQLNEFENYADLLKAKILENKDAFDAVENGNANFNQNERADFLNNELREERIQTRKNYEILLKEYQGYLQERKLKTEQFQRDYSQMIASGDLENAEARKEAYESEMADLDEQQLKKKEAYKALFAEIADLTRKEARIIIANAKKLLETLDPESESYKKLSKLLKEFEKDLNNFETDKVYELSQALGFFGEQLERLGEVTGNPALTGMGRFLSGLSEGLQLFSRAMEAQNTEDEMDDYLVALEGVMTLINMVATAAAQRRQAEEDYYNAVIALQNSYNLGLQEQLLLQGELGDNAWIKDYEGRLRAGNVAMDEAIEGYQSALEQLEEGRVQTGTRNAVNWGAVGQGAATGAAVGSFLGPIGTAVGGLVGGLVGLFGGRESREEWSNLLNEFPNLIEEGTNGMAALNTELAQSLIDHGLLNEETEGLVQNALDWQQAIEDANNLIREVIVELSGSLGNDLRNALVDAFQSGENAAEAMGDTVEKVLENILSNMLFNRIFSEAFEELEDQMANSFDVGGDGNWVDDFSRFFDEASGLTEDFDQALRDARDQAEGFGFDIFQPEETDDTPGGLAGAIRRELTEETGSELTGLFRGQFDITKRHFQLAERSFELEQRHYDVAMRTLQEVALIQQNTASTVVQLKYAVEELKKINNDGSASARDMGRG